MTRFRFETMGTVVSLDLDLAADRSFDAARETFRLYDEAFSLYDPRSPLSAVASGELPLSDAPALVRDEYARALDWRAATGGWFTPHRPDGVVDLSGTVKAVAMAEVAGELAARGARGMLGVGGDIAVIGTPQTPPRVGVVDPADRTRLLTALDLVDRRAIATSGSAERGAHIWTRLGRTDVMQATVLAADIVTADVLATALVAAGSEHLDELTERFDIDVLVVTSDGGLRATPGMRVAYSRA